jgi:hypothetical protein
MMMRQYSWLRPRASKRIILSPCLAFQRSAITCAYTTGSSAIARSAGDRCGCAWRSLSCAGAATSTYTGPARGVSRAGRLECTESSGPIRRPREPCRATRHCGRRGGAGYGRRVPNPRTNRRGVCWRHARGSQPDKAQAPTEAGHAKADASLGARPRLDRRLAIYRRNICRRKARN